MKGFLKASWSTITSLAKRILPGRVLIDFYARAVLIEVFKKMVLLIISGFFFLLFLFVYRKFYPVKATEDTIARRLENLNAISRELSSLKGFVEAQKESLALEQRTLERLKKEKESLEPLVSADREIVEAIFKQQERDQAGRIWFERGLGFALGVLSSLVASIVYDLFKKRKSPTSKEDETPP